MGTLAQTEAGLLAAVTPVLLDHEGERLHVYDDIFGNPTIGVGFLMTRPDAQALCQQCGANYQRLLGGLDDLTQAQSRWLLQQSAIGVIEWLAQVFPKFNTFTQPRQVALLDMGYNLGELKFRGFKQMVGCILAGDWAGAADQALHSTWALEVPGRADYDAGLLRTG
jgi:GH24 family phage-related lysozyme (muramidase)